MSFLDIIGRVLGGSPGQIVSTPPFIPGSMPGLDYKPGNPGIAGLLEGALVGGSMPNTGAGPTDVIRAMAAGLGTSKARDQQNLQRRMSVMEMGRKMDNDAILAHARLAEAEKDLADAQKRRAEALKKPETVYDKFLAAKKVPGMTDEAAMAYATGNHSQSKPEQQIEITPQAAAAAGLSIPMTEKDVQVPYSGPPMPGPWAGGMNTGPAAQTVRQRVADTTSPMKVPLQAGITAMQSYSGQTRARDNAANHQAKPQYKIGKNDQGVWTYQQLNPDGTFADTGLQAPISEPKQGGGSKGSASDKVTERRKAERSYNMEKDKDAKFSKVLQGIESDPDNVMKHTRDALDIQQSYEDQIRANGGEVAPEDHAMGVAAVTKMIADRVAAVKAERDAKKEEKDGGSSLLDKATRRVRGSSPAPSKAKDPLGIR